MLDGGENLTSITNHFTTLIRPLRDLSTTLENNSTSIIPGGRCRSVHFYILNITFITYVKQQYL